MNNYDDIINAKRPVSTKHPPMSRDARAAQFAPYAALVGHKEIIADQEENFLQQADDNYTIINTEELDIDTFADI